MALLMLFSYSCSKRSTRVRTGAMKSTFPHVPVSPVRMGTPEMHFEKIELWNCLRFNPLNMEFSCKQPKHNNTFAALQRKQHLRGQVLLHPCSYVFHPTHAIPFWNHYFIMSTTKIRIRPVNQAPTSQQEQLW